MPLCTKQTVLKLKELTLTFFVVTSLLCLDRVFGEKRDSCYANFYILTLQHAVRADCERK